MIDKNELKAKRSALENANQQLKKEFFGIDLIIDQLCRNVESWVLFPEMQERPLIVNLWGMTGVGKTALVKRLVELLNMDKVFFRFDMGDSAKGWSVRHTLTELLGKENGKPIILVFDEFQHAGTIDKKGEVSEKPMSRLVWEIMDSGTFNDFKNAFFSIDSIIKLMYLLRFLISKGVKVEKGLVVKNQDIFHHYISKDSHVKRMDFYKEFSNDKSSPVLDFIPKGYIESILDLIWPVFKTEVDLQNHLNSLNEKQTIDLLEDVYNNAISPETFDCRKSLIFVIGNLDEAYNMSGNYNPDMSADDFHKQSLKIKSTHIKLVLRQNFRHEQIARLGNTHLIYPALNEKAFKMIIRQQFKSLVFNYATKHQIQLEFPESMVDLVFREGVVPSLGVRPMLSTINQMVSSNIGLVISEMARRDIMRYTATFQAEESSVKVVFSKSGIIDSKMSYEIIPELSLLRKSSNDDIQAIVATHEAGHAVLHLVLNKLIPDRIFSVSASANLAGFIEIDHPWKYKSRASLLNEIASLLGGIVAEELVFGKDNVTSGATSDIESATNIVSSMVRQMGMGAILADVNLPEPLLGTSYLDLDGTINNEVKNILLDARKLAVNTLNENRKLLLNIAFYLTEHSCMNKEKLKEILEKSFTRIAAHVCDGVGNGFPYRDTLLRQCDKHSALISLPMANMQIAYNMDEKEPKIL